MKADCDTAISHELPARKRLHVPLENLRSPILMGESLGLEICRQMKYKCDWLGDPLRLCRISCRDANWLLLIGTLKYIMQRPCLNLGKAGFRVVLEGLPLARASDSRFWLSAQGHLLREPLVTKSKWQ